jgi:hypothetical protein
MEIKLWIMTGLTGFLVTVFLIGFRLLLKRFDSQISLLEGIKSALAVQKNESEHIKDDIKEIKEQQKEHSFKIRELELHKAASKKTDYARD